MLRRDQIRFALVDPETRGLSFQTTPAPELTPGEVLIEIQACTLCGSDLHSLAGRRALDAPMILGHEACGVVAAIGDSRNAWDDSPLNVGDPVTWSVIDHCGQCWNCQHGMTRKCQHLEKFGHTSNCQRPLYGGLAEACRLGPGTAIFQLPEGLDRWVACPANCATATCMASIEDVNLAGATVVVTGCGMLGLTACAIAADAGAAEVIATDLIPERAQLARQFGATQTLSGIDWRESFEAIVSKASQGRGADLVIEVTGIASVMEAATDVARIGGDVRLVGAVFPGPPIALDPETIVRRLLNIRGVHNYEPQHLAQALTFLAAAQSRFPFRELVTPFAGLDSLPTAVETARQSGTIRAGIDLAQPTGS